jgi:regulation of enolase protein 1 (concanavalin A-like superfamily)
MELQISNFPRHFSSNNESSWNVNAAENTITGVALPHSDIFIDPGGPGNQLTSVSRHNAATLMMPAPSGDFQFQSVVDVDFKDMFDAGALLIRFSESVWAKLCFEYSPDKEPMVVSVINKGGTSDDANAFTVEGRQINLRISKKSNVYAFHASSNGLEWILIRVFSFDSSLEEAEIGFEVQAPTGDGCTAIFSNYSLNNTTISDFRNGQ